MNDQSRSIDPDIDTIPDSAIIKRYLDIRDEKKALEDRHKLELAPYHENLAALAGYMLLRLNRRGADNTKVKDVGTAYKSTTTSATCVDRDKFLKYVRDHEAWDLLTTHVAKDAALDVREKTGQPPDGVTMSVEVSVRFRKA
jgi:hypothetical protein